MNKMKAYMIEDSVAKAGEIKYSLRRLYGTDLDIVWISPKGISEELVIEGGKLVDYDYSIMSNALEETLDRISGEKDITSFFIVDLCLNEQERNYVKRCDPSSYISKTAKQIVSAIAEKKLKIIITSSVPETEALWEKMLKLKEGLKGGQDIIFIPGQAFEGGNEIDWIKKDVLDIFLA